MTRTILRISLWASGPALVAIGLLLRWLHFSTDEQVLYYGADPMLLAAGITVISVVLLVIAIWLLAGHDGEAERLLHARREAKAAVGAARTRVATLQAVTARQRTTLRTGLSRTAGRVHVRLIRSGRSGDRDGIERDLAQILGIGHVLGR